MPGTPDQVWTPVDVLDAAEAHLHDRMVAELRARFGRHDIGAYLSNRTGVDQQRVQRVLERREGGKKWLVRDLLSWGMAVGLDLFDLLPRTREQLLPLSELGMLQGWQPGDPKPPGSRALDFAAVLLRTVVEDFELYDRRDALRLLRPEQMIASLVREVLYVGTPPDAIDICARPSTAYQQVLGQDATRIDLAIDLGDGVAAGMVTFGVSATRELVRDATYRLLMALSLHSSRDRFLTIVGDRRALGALGRAEAFVSAQPGDVLTVDQAELSLSLAVPNPASLPEARLLAIHSQEATDGTRLLVTTLK